MKRIIILIAVILAGLTAQAQEWKFEIEPMYFSCAGTDKYNDTADVMTVKLTGNISGSNMELFCELSNSRTGIAMRPGRMYYVPISVLALLIATEKDIQAINQVLAAFDIEAIEEIQ